MPRSEAGVRLNDVIRLTRRQRCRLRAWGKIRRLGKREKRKDFSRDELVDYMRRNGIRSWRVLVRKRIMGDPTPFDYRKAFGRWSKAVEVAFGKDPLMPTVDVNYALQAVPFLGAWTWRKYLAARRSRPDIIPSARFIRREFGKFGEFIACARGMSLEQTMERYRALWRKMGHRPTVDECRERGIILEFAIEFFEGKAGLDWQIKRTVEKKRNGKA